MSRMSIKSFALMLTVLSVFFISGCPSAAPVKEEGPEPPRNLLGTTDELQLVTELLFSLARDYGSESILVVLSVDNTLLETSDQPGQCGFDGAPRAVQRDTAEQVQRMQELGPHVIAISGQGMECQGQVLEALDVNGISFAADGDEINSLNSSELIENGVIFTAGNNKGEALKQVLASTGETMPALIVVVDHRQKDLNQVMGAFSFSEVKVHAWRYTRLETQAGQLNTAQN